jgi:hypothetical protein
MSFLAWEILHFNGFHSLILAGNGNLFDYIANAYNPNQRNAKKRENNFINADGLFSSTWTL